MQQLSPVHGSAPPTSGHHSGRLTISDPSVKKRKKRLDQMNASEVIIIKLHTTFDCSLFISC